MKQILDACCGSRMFWFNKEHPAASLKAHGRMICAEDSRSACAS